MVTLVTQVRAAQRLLKPTNPQVASAQKPAQALLNYCSEQVVSSRLSGCDLRLSSAEQPLSSRPYRGKLDIIQLAPGAG